MRLSSRLPQEIQGLLAQLFDSPESGYYPGAEELRATEFSRLGDSIYLDNAGAALHSEKQLSNFVAQMNSIVLGNPHSQSTASKTTQDLVDRVRHTILNYFNTDSRRYHLIFTSGTTAALKLVGECFDWSPSSKFCYSELNHNSVLGIREYALRAGGSFQCLSTESLLQDMLESVTPSSTLANHLFAFPSQCNFSGVQLPTSLAGQWKKRGDANNKWFVLMDAASQVSTQPIDLNEISPDFMVLSFYKIFGFPTGLGALFIKTESLEVLNKTYFSGGTVAVSLAGSNFKQFRTEAAARFEDGTIDYCNIVALNTGFEQIKRIGIKQIASHTKFLTTVLVKCFLALKHPNGFPVVQIYGHNQTHPSLGQGPIIAFNVLNSRGGFVGYAEVEKLASLYSIQVRTGCFCNPGACSSFLGLTDEQIKANFMQGHVCWDDNDLIDGKPTGAVRISLPYFTSKDDVDTILKWITHCFIQKEEILMAPKGVSQNQFHLLSVTIYPIKSCGGVVVSSPWPIARTGLKFDREWTLVETDKDDLPYVNQKRFPSLGIIGTAVDPEDLIVQAKDMSPLKISLTHYPSQDAVCRVCGDETKGHLYSDEVSDWFCRFIGSPVGLIRQAPEPQRQPKSTKVDQPQQGLLKSVVNIISSLAYPPAVQSALSFANESQFLLIASASFEDLKSRLSPGDAQNLSVNSFRPNFFVKTDIPFEEDDWERVSVGDQHFDASGPCNRCRMICIDPVTLVIGTEPLKTLSQYRRNDSGKIFFGMLFVHDSSSATPHVLDPSKPLVVVKRKL